MRTFAALGFGVLLISACDAGSTLLRSSGSSRTHRADDGLGNYEFGYDEVHSTGGTFRRESGSAGGVKVGSYGLRDIDGRYRVVNYVADAAGFRAQVSTNEPGTAPSLTGAASYNAAPLVAPARLADIASPIYGTRVAQAAPAVAPVPAFSAAPTVYSGPARLQAAAPIAFGTRVPVASRVAYAPISVAPASPIRTYAAPVAAPIATAYAYAPRAIPTYAAAPVPVVPSYATRFAAPITTFSAPVRGVPVAYAAPAYAAPVRTYAAAPVANAGPAPAAPAAPPTDLASMNSAPASEALRPRNNARLFSEADAPVQSAPASTPLSTAESNSTEVVAPQTANFFTAPRVNFSAPQFSFPSPASVFDSAPFPFNVARFNSARTAPVSDAPVTPVPTFAPVAPVTTSTTPAPEVPVANSTAPAFNAPFQPFIYSFPEQQQQQVQTTPAPAVASRGPTTLAPSAPFLSAVNAAFPAGTYAGPIATPRVNETAQRYSTPAPPVMSSPTTDSPAAFLSSRRDEFPFDHRYAFSSQRLRAPVYAPVVAAAPIVPQYAVYAPVAHYTSSVHTRVDFAPSHPARRHDQQRQAPTARPEASTTTPEVPQPEAPTPSPQTEAPVEVPSTQAPVEVTTPLPSADDDEDVADPRNAPPMFSAREESSATTTTQPEAATTSSATETTVAPTTEVPVAAEANRQPDTVEQRSPAQDAAPLLSADRPVAARVVARRRPSFSVYSSRVVRAPSAYRVFVPQYAHVKSAPVAHYAAAPVVIPKVGHVVHAVPAVRYY